MGIRKRFGQIFNNNHALSSIFVSEEGAVIIDVAETDVDANKIFEILKKNNISECTIFFTHGHSDHIKAFEKLSQLCEKENIAIRKVITDERNLKIPFLTKVIENYLIKDWQKHNIYNGIELTKEKIDLYFSENSDKLSKAEVKAIRDCSMFLAKNENAKHIPIEEQYIIKAYLLNKPFGEAYKEYKKNAKKNPQNIEDKTVFIHRAVEWAKWKNNKNHIFDRFVKIPYSKEEPYTTKEFKQYGYKITAISVKSEGIEISDRDNTGPLYIVEDSKTKLKTLITGDLPLKMQENICKYIEQDKKLSKLFQDVDVLQIPHHGSLKNYFENFIKIVNPKIGVIPEIRNNHYGSASKNFFEKIKNLNLPVLITGDYGDIKFNKDKKLLFVKSEGIENNLKKVLVDREQSGYTILGKHIETKGLVFTSNEEDKKKMAKVIEELEFNKMPIWNILKEHFDFLADISTRNLDFSKRSLKEEIEFGIKKAKEIFTNKFKYKEETFCNNEQVKELPEQEKEYKQFEMFKNDGLDKNIILKYLSIDEKQYQMLEEKYNKNIKNEKFEAKTYNQKLSEEREKIKSLEENKQEIAYKQNNDRGRI